MLNENKMGQTEPMDPYIKQTPVKYLTDFHYDDRDNEDIRILDFSKYDYDKFRNKRQYDISRDSLDLDPDEELQADPTSDPTPKQETEVKEYFLVPLYVITGFFACMMFIGPLLVKKGPNRGIIQSSIMIAAFCMWIFWFTIYFGQMNPLMGPRLENTTVAWIAYKLGKSVQGQSSTSASTTPTTTTSPTTNPEPPPTTTPGI